jgi:hypothetical protein
MYLDGQRGAATPDVFERATREVYRLKPGSTCRAITAFASRMARPSSPVRSKHSLAIFAQSSFRAQVVALCVCLSASFGVHGICSGSCPDEGTAIFHAIKGVSSL